MYNCIQIQSLSLIHTIKKEITTAIPVSAVPYPCFSLNQQHNTIFLFLLAFSRNREIPKRLGTNSGLSPQIHQPSLSEIPDNGHYEAMTIIPIT